jgi:hypothetical protein
MPRRTSMPAHQDAEEPSHNRKCRLFFPQSQRTRWPNAMKFKPNVWRIRFGQRVAHSFPSLKSMIPSAVQGQITS